MSYAIGDIIYGINLTTDSDVDKVFNTTVNQDDLDAFLDGVCETSYSGDGDSPRYFGVDMGGLDECSNERGSAVIAQMTATATHKAAYQAKLDEFLKDDEFSQEFRDIVKNIEPDVWLLWGSS